MKTTKNINNTTKENEMKTYKLNTTIIAREKQERMIDSLVRTRMTEDHAEFGWEFIDEADADYGDWYESINIKMANEDVKADTEQKIARACFAEYNARCGAIRERLAAIKNDLF